nr:MAG TPA: hypothetical protein [Caudoviricetes sp.]
MLNGKIFIHIARIFFFTVSLFAVSYLINNKLLFL